MSITTIRNALQAVHVGITGVISAPTTYPASLNASELPLVLTWPADGSSHQEAMGSLRRQDRTYRVQVFVAPVVAGDFDEYLQLCLTLLQRFIEVYINPETVVIQTTPNQGTIQISEDNPVTDSGVAVLTYGGTNYHGFVIDVGTYEKW